MKEYEIKITGKGISEEITNSLRTLIETLYYNYAENNPIEGDWKNKILSITIIEK